MDISVVVPLYNEEESLPELFAWIERVMNANGFSYEVIFVNDGSTDRSWQVIEQLQAQAPDKVRGIKFRRNYGKSPALFCGFEQAQGDVVITMDADLQDDIDAIDAMLTAFQNGNDIVYGVRSKRDTDTFFKRFTAESFYKILNAMGAEVVFNHADYRLMSARVLHEFANFKEVNLFLRGIVPLIGFKSDYVYYDRAERFAGESKYPLKKMISFALDGITSFSVKPLKLISNLGILISVLSIFGLLYALISHLCGVTVAGWTAIVASIWLLGGLQMLCLGVVGGYIGKIYSEVKRRPRFLIETHLKAEPEEKVLDEH